MFVILRYLLLFFAPYLYSMEEVNLNPIDESKLEPGVMNFLGESRDKGHYIGKFCSETTVKSLNLEKNSAPKDLWPIVLKNNPPEMFKRIHLLENQDLYPDRLFLAGTIYFESSLPYGKYEDGYLQHFVLRIVKRNNEHQSTWALHSLELSKIHKAYEAYYSHGSRYHYEDDFFRSHIGLDLQVWPENGIALPRPSEFFLRNSELLSKREILAFEAHDLAARFENESSRYTYKEKYNELWLPLLDHRGYRYLFDGKNQVEKELLKDIEIFNKAKNKIPKFKKRGGYFWHKKYGYLCSYQVKGDEMPIFIEEDIKNSIINNAQSYEFKEGKIYHKSEEFSTKEGYSDYRSSEPLYIVSADKKGVIYINKRTDIVDKKGKEDCIYHTILVNSKARNSKASSFAGTLMAEKGKITYLSNESGHYRTTEFQLIQFLIILEKQGVLSPDLKIMSYDTISYLFTPPDENGNFTFGQAFANAYKNPSLYDKIHIYSNTLSEFKYKHKKEWSKLEEKLKKNGVIK